MATEVTGQNTQIVQYNELLVDSNIINLISLWLQKVTGQNAQIVQYNEILVDTNSFNLISLWLRGGRVTGQITHILQYN